MRKFWKRHLAPNYLRTCLCAIVLFATVASVVFSQNPSLAFNLLKTSTLSGLKHASFDGTAYPFANSFLWTEIDAANWKSDFASINNKYKIDPLVYDSSLLAKNIKDLGFDTQDTYTRNLKINYPVVYMGNYELDGQEGGGSHPAVDIKLPTGTPILSIANGIVTKVESQPYGFGNHVVVRHNNVPSLDDPGSLQTIFSSYSHLDTMDVKVGDIVTKGQQIALSGNSGLTTTPHLHFQIDKDNFPWQPYWPFTGPELNAAGLDFFQALNSGFKQEEAYQHTIHPMQFVQKFLIYKSNDSQEVEPELVSEEAVLEPELREESVLDLREEPVIIDDVSEEKLLEIRGPKKMIMGQKYSIFVDNLPKSLLASSDMSDFNLTSNKKAMVVNKVFANDTFMFEVMPSEIGSYVYSFSNQGQEYKLKSEVLLFKDIALGNNLNELLFNLVRKNVISGYPDGSFMPANHLHRAELAAILDKLFALANTQPVDLNFQDVSKSDWYYPAVLKLTSNGFFENDTSFNPAAFVRLNELIKVLFLAYKIDIDLATTDRSLLDTVAFDDWSYPYMLYALKSGVLNSDQIKAYDEYVTREQLIQILTKFLNS